MGNAWECGHQYRAKGSCSITFGTHNRKAWLSNVKSGCAPLKQAAELLMAVLSKIAADDPVYELCLTTRTEDLVR